MSDIQVIEDLCHICEVQNAIIKAQANAIAQHGAVMMEDERVAVDHALTVLADHIEAEK